MGRQCQEPYCLQIVPDHLFQSHQDEHLAERLAAEEFENQRRNQHDDVVLARAMANAVGVESSSRIVDSHNDYKLALALNREIRAEEEERTFRVVQVPHSYLYVSICIRKGKYVWRAKRKKSDTARF